MSDIRAEWIINNYQKLKAERGVWENHWQEIADFVIPQKDQVTQQSLGGEKKNTDLFDSTAIHSNELLASALHSMLTNPAVQWFDMITGDSEIDKDHDARQWLQNAVKKIHQVLNDSNFQTEIHETFLELPSFGTNVVFIEEDIKDLIRFSSRPISESVFDENEKGVANQLYRCYQFTGHQLLNKFGRKAFEQDDIDKFMDDPYTKHEIIHAIIPNDKFNPFKKSFGNRKIASIYVLKNKKRIIREGGYDEFPAAVPRWTKQSYEKYGRSPAMKCLPEIKLINEVKKTMIISAQKQIDPALQAPDEGMVLPLRTSPGSINYYRAGSKDRIMPLDTGGRVDFGYQFIEDLKIQIRQTFFIDQLQLRDGPQMTATEVMQRTEEQLRTMGPILGRLHNELLKPIIERTFGILLRKGVFDDAPDILRDIDFKIQYSSMIARSQRSGEADNISRLLQVTTPMMQMNPAVIENLDLDNAFRYIADIYNVPAEVLKSKEEMESDREAQAQLAMEQQAQAEENQQVENVAKLQQGQQGQ